MQHLVETFQSTIQLLRPPLETQAAAQLYLWNSYGSLTRILRVMARVSELGPSSAFLASVFVAIRQKTYVSKRQKYPK